MLDNDRVGRVMMKWYRDRKARRMRDSYLAGFGWAMSAYYVENTPINQIDMCVGFGPSTLNPWRKISDIDIAFDDGVERAVDTIYRMGESK